MFYTFEHTGSEGKVNLHRLSLKDVRGNVLATWTVRSRDLLVTVYLDIEMDTDSEPHTMTAVFDKANRWLKIKFVAEPGCTLPDANWIRSEQVGSFAELIGLVATTIDRNLKIACYSAE
jgi:hypothetical protein